MGKRGLLIVLLIVSVLSLWAALVVGSVALDWHEIMNAFSGRDSLAHTLIMDLRMPRALTAFVTGAMLALAGCLMQVLLRNPLADPYILGISGGASGAALMALLLGAGRLVTQVSAFAGALVSMFMVFFLARGTGSWTPARLLLTGVVIAAGWNAWISFLLSVSPDPNLAGMMFWLMGDLSQARAPHVEGVLLIILFSVTLYVAPSLNQLARGELQAASLGVSVERLRLLIFVLASLLTATAVSMAGNIGFVGLLVPHMIRLLIGSDHRVLLPASLLLGGSVLVIADTLARSVLSPHQLPVGILTALIGVPVFLFLLYRSR